MLYTNALSARPDALCYADRCATYASGCVVLRKLRCHLPNRLMATCCHRNDLATKAHFRSWRRQIVTNYATGILNSDLIHVLT